MLIRDVPCVKVGWGYSKKLAKMTTYILNTPQIILTQITADTASSVPCSSGVLDASVKRFILTRCSSSWETANYPSVIFRHFFSCVRVWSADVLLFLFPPTKVTTANSNSESNLFLQIFHWPRCCMSTSRVLFEKPLSLFFIHFRSK
jgi:hypothetical protein